jgi:hypothetical protein
LTPRKVASLLGAAALGVTVVTGVGAATGSPARASVARLSLSRLSPGQVTARLSGGSESVVVVFDDQLGNLPANPTNRHAREVAAASMEAPLVAQLKQVGATSVRPLWLLNAVAATMPAAEAQALSRTPGVKEVVPDGTVIIGGGAWNTPTVAASRVRTSSIPGTAADGQQLCNAAPGKRLRTRPTRSKRPQSRLARA